MSCTLRTVCCASTPSYTFNSPQLSLGRIENLQGQRLDNCPNYSSPIRQVAQDHQLTTSKKHAPPLVQ